METLVGGNEQRVSETENAEKPWRSKTIKDMELKVELV